MFSVDCKRNGDAKVKTLPKGSSPFEKHGAGAGSIPAQSTYFIIKGGYYVKKRS